MSTSATNRYEQGLLWVIRHHGEDGVLEYLEPGASHALDSVLSAESPNGTSRAAVTPGGRRGSSGNPGDHRLDEAVAATLAGLRTRRPAELCIPRVCHSQTPHGIDAAIDAAVDSPRTFFVEFGAWLLGRVLQESDRREVARWGVTLSGRQRRAFGEGHRDRRPVVEDEGNRIREAFDRFGQHVDGLDERLYRLGLFGVATATVRRFRQRLNRLADALEPRERDRCLHYYRRAWSSSRRSVAYAFRETLQAFTGWHCAKGGDDVGR